MTDSSARSTDSDSLGGVADQARASQIRLTHLFYGAAMLAAALATFGPGGIPLGIGIVAFWAWIFLQASRPQRLFEALTAALIPFCLCGMLLPAVRFAPEAARRSSCGNNLKQITIALHNYHESYKTLPPAYIADAEGRPMHSWRVLILPFLDEQKLYERYRFDEPWDGPNNRTLAAEMPYTYACPSDRRTHPDGRVLTSYVAVVDANTAWPLDQGRALRDFVDGASNTLLVLENKRTPIPWMAPRDLTFEEAVAALASPELEDYGHVREDFFYTEARGRHTAMADGSVRFVANLPSEMATRLIGVDNGAPEDIDGQSYGQPLYRQANYGNWFRLAFFVLLLVLPLPWVWVHPHRSRPSGPDPHDHRFQQPA